MMASTGRKICSYHSMLLKLCLLFTWMASGAEVALEDLSAALVAEITGEKLISQVRCTVPKQGLLALGILSTGSSRHPITHYHMLSRCESLHCSRSLP